MTLLTSTTSQCWFLIQSIAILIYSHVHTLLTLNSPLKLEYEYQWTRSNLLHSNSVTSTCRCRSSREYSTCHMHMHLLYDSSYSSSTCALRTVSNSNLSKDIDKIPDSFSTTRYYQPLRTSDARQLNDTSYNDKHTPYVCTSITLKQLQTIRQTWSTTFDFHYKLFTACFTLLSYSFNLVPCSRYNYLTLWPQGRPRASHDDCGSTPR